MTTRNPGFSDLPREKLYNVKPYYTSPTMVLTCTPSMTHPRPPCIMFRMIPVSTLACSKILVPFIQAWWEKLHSQKAPLISVWYSTPISSHLHIAYRTIFRHLSRSICHLEDPLRFTFLSSHSEGRLELSFN